MNNETCDSNVKPAKKRHGCGCLTAFLVFVGVMVALGIVGIFILAALPGGGTSRLPKSHGTNFDPSNYGEDECPNMVEVWSSGCGTTRVVRIPLTGMIHFGEGSAVPGAIGGTESTLRAIRRATLDDSVKGILLDVDSGGGGITASDIVYDALLKFRAAQPGRVIVAHFGDTAASGAYYISLAADCIIASPTTLTGSIGVIMQSYNVHGLAEKIGVTDVTLKSGANKDLLNPLAEVDPEQQALLQEVVDQLYARFVGLVAENRHLPETKVRELADGRVFLAQKALDEGLIDGIGYEDDAIAKLAELLGEEDLEVDRYEENFSVWDIFRRERSIFGMKMLLDGLFDSSSPALQYRWPVR